MLELKVHDGEKKVTLRFEHSLLALSKWESRTKTPWFSHREKTASEMLDYFKDMLVDPEIDPNLVHLLEPEQLESIVHYINDSQTASSVPEQKGRGGSGEQITSELIYYWMVGMKIPFHPAETWHLNRLMMLIQIANIKNQPPKKRPVAETMARWREINEERKRKYNTSG